ncbi:unnamed protein product [Rotaria socialis]
MCSVGLNTEKLTTEYTDGISSGAPTTPTLCPMEHRLAPTLYSSGAPTTPTLCLIGAPTSRGKKRDFIYFKKNSKYDGSTMEVHGSTWKYDGSTRNDIGGSVVGAPLEYTVGARRCSTGHSVGVVGVVGAPLSTPSVQVGAPIRHSVGVVGAPLEYTVGASRCSTGYSVGVVSAPLDTLSVQVGGQ